MNQNNLLRIEGRDGSSEKSYHVDLILIMIEFFSCHMTAPARTEVRQLGARHQTATSCLFV